MNKIPLLYVATEDHGRAVHGAVLRPALRLQDGGREVALVTLSGYKVGSDMSPAEWAKLIADAVNAHQALREAMELADSYAQSFLDHWESDDGMSDKDRAEYKEARRNYDECIRTARKLIADAVNTALQCNCRTGAGEWSGSPNPKNPDNEWLCDACNRVIPAGPQESMS